MISSAKSVSIAATPSRCRASFKPISSVVSDLILTTSLAPWPVTMPVMISIGLVGVACPVHLAPGPRDGCLELDEITIKMLQIRGP